MIVIIVVANNRIKAHFLEIKQTVLMILALYYLIASSRMEQEIKSTAIAPIKRPKVLYGVGLVAIIMTIASFLTLLFSFSDDFANNSINRAIIDRYAVEMAIEGHSTIIIDARPEFQYELGHLPQAINIPYDSGVLPAFVERHDLQQNPLIVYCSNRHCDAAELLVQKLHNLGCQNVSIYPGGWEEWITTQ